MQEWVTASKVNRQTCATVTIKALTHCVLIITTVLMEPSPRDLAATELQVDEALLNLGHDSIAVIRVSNLAGFTHQMEQNAS